MRMIRGHLARNLNQLLMESQTGKGDHQKLGLHAFKGITWLVLRRWNAGMGPGIQRILLANPLYVISQRYLTEDLKLAIA